MNIEKAIKVVRNIKNINFLGCKECVFDNDTKCIKENGEDCQEIAIETLLTAYEKEKEKNKKLQDKAKELIFEKQELTYALLDSTPNDKIKAKIEELEKEYKEAYNKGFKTDMVNRLREIKLMQSLLEKE